MPLHRLNAPPPSFSLLKSLMPRLSALIQRHPHLTALELGEALDSKRVECHLPVYSVGLRPLALGRGPGASKRVSWRYLLRTKRGVSVAIEVTARKARHSFAQLQEGEFVNKIWRRIRAAEKHKQMKVGPYHLRTLQIPALHFEALWLKHAKNRDVFIPVVRIPGKLQVGRRYTTEKLSEALTIQAKRALEAYANLGQARPTPAQPSGETKQA